MDKDMDNKFKQCGEKVIYIKTLIMRLATFGISPNHTCSPKLFIETCSGLKSGSICAGFVNFPSSFVAHWEEAGLDAERHRFNAAFCEIVLVIFGLALILFGLSICGVARIVGDIRVFSLLFEQLRAFARGVCISAFASSQSVMHAC